MDAQPLCRVIIPPDAHPLVLRAADELSGGLAEATGQSCEISQAGPAVGAVTLRIESVGDGEGDAWAIDESDGGLLVRAGRPRLLYRAAWDLLDRLGAAQSVAPGLVRPPIGRLVAIWDQLGCGYNRNSVGFDWDEHLAEAARMGISHLECNALPGAFTIQDDQPDDPYLQWNLFGPALDQYVESELTAGLYPPAWLSANRDALRRMIARFAAYDLDPVMLVYEPRWLPERFFARHPHLRGPRTDHPGRGLTPRYALDVDHPAVLAHYRELAARLIEVAPQLTGLVLIGEDSGAGFSFTAHRYAGPNGPYRARMHSVGQRVADFCKALADGLAADGRDRRLLHVADSYEWKRELPDVLQCLDKRVAVLHTIPQEDFHEVDGVRVATAWHGANQVRIDPAVRGHCELVRSTGHDDLPMAVINGWLTEPVVGAPMPWVMAEKFANLADAGCSELSLYGGHLSRSQTPWPVNQVVARHALRDPRFDAEALIGRLADRWAGPRAAELLDAWRTCDTGVRVWPFYPTGDHRGPDMVWYRNLYRPIAVRLDLLDPAIRRRIYRHSMNAWFDPARYHYLWEGTRKRYEPAVAAGVADRVRRHVVEPLRQAAGRLRAAAGPNDCLTDQADRIAAVAWLADTRACHLLLGALLDDYYEGRPPADPAQRRADLDCFRRLAAAEVANTREAIALIERTGAPVVLQSEQETPFILGTDVCERLEEKIRLTEAELSNPATEAFFIAPFTADPWPYQGAPTVPAIFRDRQ